MDRLEKGIWLESATKLFKISQQVGHFIRRPMANLKVIQTTRGQSFAKDKIQRSIEQADSKLVLRLENVIVKEIQISNSFSIYMAVKNINICHISNIKWPKLFLYFHHSSSLYHLVLIMFLHSLKFKILPPIFNFPVFGIIPLITI